MAKSTKIIWSVAIIVVLICVVFVWRSRDAIIPEPIPTISAVSDSLIIIDEPKPNFIISSPLKIKGRARGPWYFEASFPIELIDQNGKTLAQGIAQAQDDWMTENFVPFQATLLFASPSYGNVGTLIFKKDNPSGDPRFDDSRRIPIRFNQ